MPLAPRPVCEHLLILENSPLPGLYDAQRRTWLRWAFADPAFDAERCLIIVSSSAAPLGNSTEKRPQLLVARDTPAVETESCATGNNKWARRMVSLKAARAYRFITLTVMDGDAFLCWARWRAFTRLLASKAGEMPSARCVRSWRASPFSNPPKQRRLGPASGYSLPR
jgi:hypothetical protein